MSDQRPPLHSAKVPPHLTPLFEQAQQRVMEFFSRYSVDPNRGVIEISGERFILLRADSMSVDFFDTISALYESEGSEAAHHIAHQFLFDIAHSLGRQDAEHFQQRMGFKHPMDHLAAGPIYFAYTGWSFVDIDPRSHPEPGDDFLLIYEHQSSFEADAWLAEGRHAELPVCTMNAGYSSGWCEMSFQQTLVTTEILCRAKGDPCCRFVMAPPEQIEQQIQRYRLQAPSHAEQIRNYQVPGFFRRKAAESQLRHSEAYYRSLFEHSSNLIFSITPEGQLLSGNPAFCHHLQLSQSDLPNTNIHSLVAASHQQPLHQAIQGALRSENPRSIEIEIGPHHAASLYVKLRLSPLAAPNGSLQILGIASDLSEQRERELRLRADREHFQQEVEKRTQDLDNILRSAAEGIIVLDKHGECLMLNPAACQMLGYREEALVGQHLHTLWPHCDEGGQPYPADHCPLCQSLFSNHAKRDDSEQFCHAFGNCFPVEYSCAPLQGLSQQGGVVLMFTDITERKRSEREIHLLATTDMLTGAANRYAGQQRLDQEVDRSRRYNKPVSLLMFDLDHFKAINDEHGHAVGDEVLRRISHCVRQHIRQSDLFARWGGEEFLIMTPETGLTQAEQLAEKLRQEIAQCSPSPPITACFGVVTLNHHETIDSLVKRADHATYRAKARGRNCVETDPPAS